VPDYKEEDLWRGWRRVIYIGDLCVATVFPVGVAGLSWLYKNSGATEKLSLTVTKSGDRKGEHPVRGRSECPQASENSDIR